MLKKKKKYKVNINAVWSFDFDVSAATEAEAKRLAWEKFCATVNKRKRFFKLYANQVD